MRGLATTWDACPVRIREASSAKVMSPTPCRPVIAWMVSVPLPAGQRPAAADEPDARPGRAHRAVGAACAQITSADGACHPGPAEGVRAGATEPGFGEGHHGRFGAPRSVTGYPADRRGRGAGVRCGDHAARGDGGDRPLPQRARSARLRRGRGRGGVVRGGPPGHSPHRRARRRGARPARRRGPAVPQQRLALPGVCW